MNLRARHRRSRRSALGCSRALLFIIMPAKSGRNSTARSTKAKGRRDCRSNSVGPRLGPCMAIVLRQVLEYSFAHTNRKHSPRAYDLAETPLRFLVNKRNEPD